MKTLLLILIALLPAHSLAKKAPPSNPLVKKVSAARFEVSHSKAERIDGQAQLGTFTAFPAFGFDASGIKVTRFSSKCLLPRFGLKEGDVVELVNGNPLTTPADIMEVGNKLAKAKPGHKVRVHLRRGSEELTLTYLLVD